MPTETSSLDLFLLSCYFRALPSCPCQPRVSLAVLTSLISLLPASQMVVLSLLLSCSLCPSKPVSKTGAEAFALQSSATGSDRVSCSLLSCLCSPVHLCSDKWDLSLFTSSVSHSNLFPSSSVCLHPHRNVSCLLQIESPHLPQIKWLAQLLSTCCTGNSQANDKCHTNTPRPGNQIHC